MKAKRRYRLSNFSVYRNGEVWYPLPSRRGEVCVAAFPTVRQAWDWIRTTLHQRKRMTYWNGVEL